MDNVPMQPSAAANYDIQYAVANQIFSGEEGVSMAPFLNDATIGPVMSTVDLVISLTGGWGPQASHFQGPYYDVNGQLVESQTFEYSDDGSGTISGQMYGLCFFKDDGKVLGAAKFSTPRPYGNLGDGLNLIVYLKGLNMTFSDF